MDTKLLKQKILKEFFRLHPEKKNLPDDRKIWLWCEQKLKSRTGMPDDKSTAVLQTILLRRSWISGKQANFWKKYFEARLKE